MKAIDLVHPNTQCGTGIQKLTAIRAKVEENSTEVQPPDNSASCRFQKDIWTRPWPQGLAASRWSTTSPQGPPITQHSRCDMGGLVGEILAICGRVTRGQKGEPHSGVAKMMSKFDVARQFR